MKLNGLFNVEARQLEHFFFIFFLVKSVRNCESREHNDAFDIRRQAQSSAS